MVESLKTQYDKTVEEREKTIAELKKLEENEFVKKYLNLSDKCKDLRNQQKELYEKVRIEEFKHCDHIWVATLSDHDPMECRTERYYGCIKCGLNQIVYKYTWQMLDEEERIMYDFMNNGSYMKGIRTSIVCDLELAKAIYSKIKENHPNIDDNIAIKYLETALDDIRNIKVSDERKENRAKRLSLIS